MSPPVCQWCGAPATTSVEVEPARTSAATTKRKQNVLARRLPACGECRRRLARMGHKQFPLVAKGRADYWGRKQGELF